MKKGKKYLAAEKTIDATKLYTIAEAAELVKTTSTTKFDATFYDMEMELGIITPLSDNPTHYQPHGLLPTDPLYINPVSYTSFYSYY